MPNEVNGSGLPQYAHESETGIREVGTGMAFSKTACHSRLASSIAAIDPRLQAQSMGSRKPNIRERLCRSRHVVQPDPHAHKRQDRPARRECP